MKTKRFPDIKKITQENFAKAKNSFHKAWEGKEEIDTVIWIWGGAAYLLSILANKIVFWNKISFFDFLISAAVIAYFTTHIIITKRCAPKKTPLTKEEKEALKHDRAKRFFRKLFLQESVTKWNPVMVAIVIDLYIILSFAEYILKLI